MISIREMREKERRARELMDREGLDALALSTTANFAWFTCGGSNYVGLASEVGVATAVITRDAKYIVCDNIESGRILDEEVTDQGFEFATCYWYEGAKDDLIGKIAGGVLGSDAPMAGAKNVCSALDPYRYSLTDEEVERYRWVGKHTGEALAQACREVEIGMTEHDIAGLLNAKLFELGMTPGVSLVAADDRISKYRHPLPTDNKLARYAMLVTSGRKWGLIVSASRLVHFGELPAELRRKHEAVVQIDAAFINGTKPGANVGDIFKNAVDTYARTGFPDEWKLHHQGGPTGYKGREYRASLSTNAIVQTNQAYAWNPSITGTKSEDTILATPAGTEILSAVEDWPMIEVDGIARPDILVR